MVALTQSSNADSKYIGFVERIPLFLRRRDFGQWLDPRVSVQNVLRQNRQIQTNDFLKIGKWVNDPQVTAESVVLQSPLQWELEHDAKMMGLHDDDFDFGAIEAEALRQNEAAKKGQRYEAKSNWNGLSRGRADKGDALEGPQEVESLHSGICGEDAVNGENAVTQTQKMESSESSESNGAMTPSPPNVGGETVSSLDGVDGVAAVEGVVAVESNEADHSETEMKQEEEIRNEAGSEKSGSRKRKRSGIEAIEERADNAAVIGEPMRKRPRVEAEDGDEFNFSDSSSVCSTTYKIPDRRHSFDSKDSRLKEKETETESGRWTTASTQPL